MAERVRRLPGWRWLLGASACGLVVSILPSPARGEQCLRPPCGQGYRVNHQGCCVSDGSLETKLPGKSGPVTEHRCPAGQHRSAGRCCPDGEEWVPALRRCIELPASAYETEEAPADQGNSTCQPGKAVAVRAPGEWVRICAGSFTMGSPPDEPGRTEFELQHRVTLTRDFLMQATEVTQGQFQDVMGSNPSHFKACGRDCPVERLRWFDAISYCNKLSQLENLDSCYSCHKYRSEECQLSERYSAPYSCPGYRLPTEAEWEYAARAGTTTALYTGPIEILGERDAPSLEPIAWYSGNSGVSYEEAYDCSRWDQRAHKASRCGTHPVAKKRPNPWGLFDILGNVSEWCHDFEWSESGRDHYSPEPTTDPWPGRRITISHRIRGGSWERTASNIRSAKRLRRTSDIYQKDVGFRPVRTL